MASTSTQPVRHGIRWSHRWTIWLLGALVVAATLGFGIDRLFRSSGAELSGTELQRTLDQLVQSGEAPGATAYVSGPRGTWLGSAGVADVKTHTPMRPDARMRIESNSKTWLVAVILQLAEEGRLALDDTVEHWLPGLLRAHGDRITIRQLLYDAGGLIDDNDVYRASPKQLSAYITRVGDAKLRAQLLATADRMRANPKTPVPAMLFIRLAAWQPLVAQPGTTYHHSNIGWNVAGLIAAKAGGKPLPQLYRERIFQPLELQHTAFSPQGPMAGPHARGYARDPTGKLVDTTDLHPGKFADGAIVTNAQDEATFLRAAMNGTLFEKRLWLDLYGSPAIATGCGDRAYEGEGAGDGYRSYVRYDSAGDRIAVLLLNGNGGSGASAARFLYCAA